MKLEALVGFLNLEDISGKAVRFCGSSVGWFPATANVEEMFCSMNMSIEIPISNAFGQCLLKPN